MAFEPSSSAETTARRIDGRAVAAEITGRVKDATQQLTAEHGIVPGLAVVLVGDDPASQVYVGSKGRMAEELGFHSVQYTLPDTTGEAEVLALVDRLNLDEKINGILVQLPLPDARSRDPGPLHASPLRQVHNPFRRTDHQYPSFFFAELQGRAAVSKGTCPRRETDRCNGPLCNPRSR